MKASKPFFESSVTWQQLQTNMPPFAEVIESKLDHFIAQSWKWDYFPAFGSLVQVITQDRIVFGCISHVETGSMDPLRYPFPYQKTEEELMKEQPQIFEFLKTMFKVHIIGYVEVHEPQSIRYLVPPQPCKIHSFVSHADPLLQNLFFEQADYLHILFAGAHQIQNIDELLLAILRQLGQSNLLSQKLLDLFCETFSLLIGNDYRRMKLFLQRVQKIV
jgi:hypothetical protein